MNDWKDQLKDFYKSYFTTQKNTKGTPHKFDSHTNFRGKFGVNDTGIPLTLKAAKKKRTIEQAIVTHNLYKILMNEEEKMQWLGMVLQILMIHLIKIKKIDQHSLQNEEIIVSIGFLELMNHQESQELIYTMTTGHQFRNQNK